MRFSYIAILALLIPAVALAQSTPDERRLMAEFDSTIVQARQARDEFVRTPTPTIKNPGAALIPVIGGFIIAKQGLDATRGIQQRQGKVDDLLSYKVHLLQLKREMMAGHPKAWEATKKKWNIDDRYLE